MIYAITKLTEAELELMTKINLMREVEKSSDSEFITNVRIELDIQLESIREGIEELKEAHRNTIYR